MGARYQNNLAGQVDDAPLTSGATTLNSSGLANLIAVAAPDTVWLTLDPEAGDGAPEIVQVTAHTVSATSATIVRARQGTTARAHVATTVWALAATAFDYDELPHRKFTTKGDLVAATAAGAASRIGVGTSGHPLVADSAETTGMEWKQLPTAGIADSAVTTAKIADSQVTTAKIADATIGIGDLSTALLEIICPAGTVRSTVYDQADTGWLLDGSSTANAESLYPTLWAKVPVSWKSGSTLEIPSGNNAVLRGSTGTLGATSGANTKTITEAHLPAHDHTIDHNHPNVVTGANSVSHTHPVNPPLAGTSGQTANHLHTLAGEFLRVNPFTPTIIIDQQGGGTEFKFDTVANPATSNENTTHAHTIDIGQFDSGAASLNHTHGVDVPNFAGNSGSAGGGTDLNVQESGLTVRYQIKAH